MESQVSYTCIECGAPAAELYRDFKAGVIKISHCEECGKVVDKYVEYDSIIMLLDALLHKNQAYRHILLNKKFPTPWKFLLLLLLCDTYWKWESLQLEKDQQTAVEDHIFYAALEWDFYTMFVLAAAEWAIFSAIVLLCLVITNGKTFTKSSQEAMMKALVVSSFGKLLAIPAIIWGQSQSGLYLLLTRIFILTSNVTAMKVVCISGRSVAIGVMVFAHATSYLIGQYLWLWLDT